MASATYIWSCVLSQIEKSQSKTLLDTFFYDVNVVDLKDNVLILHCPNDFNRTYINSSCSNFINDALASLDMGRISFRVISDEELAEMRRSSAVSSSSVFNHDFTFQSFVVGNTNRFAYNAALAVSEFPANENSMAYNPLLIYGPSGLGKTHLLHAIANVLRINRPEYCIVYIKCEDFMNEFMDNLRQSRMVEFRNKYRNADVFLVDDIQFLGGKDSTQEEFFNTFNTLYDNHKQIVLTSDRPPEDISRLEERIKTRLQGGVLADIKSPDYETRVSILRDKFSLIHMEVPEDVVNFLSENLTSNVRQLEGAVKKINAYRMVDSDFELTIAYISNILTDLFKHDTENIVPTTQRILSEVVDYYNLSESDIMGRSQKKTITEARHITCYLIRKLTTLSFEYIGLFIGRDHTTVMASVAKIEKELPTSEHLKTVIDDITENINGHLS